MLEKMLPTRRETRRMTVRDARKVLLAQEAEKLVDRDKIHRQAIERVEQSGIVFLDEIDKICRHRIQARPRCLPPGRAARSAADRRRLHRHHQIRPGQDRSHSLHRRRRVSQQQAERSDARIAGPISHPRRVGRSDQGGFRANPARAQKFPDPPTDGTAGHRRVYPSSSPKMPSTRWPTLPTT